MDLVLRSVFFKIYLRPLSLSLQFEEIRISVGWDIKLLIVWGCLWLEIVLKSSVSYFCLVPWAYFLNLRKFWSDIAEISNIQCLGTWEPSLHLSTKQRFPKNSIPLQSLQGFYYCSSYWSNEHGAGSFVQRKLRLVTETKAQRHWVLALGLMLMLSLLLVLPCLPT